MLFGGGSKRTQAADITRARTLLAEYKARKKQRIAPAGKPRPKR